MKKTVLFFILCSILTGVANASEYSVFTKDLVKPYDFYKKSLALTTNKDEAAKAKAALGSFIEEWKGFAVKYANDPPKQFAAVSDFSAKIKRPAEVGRISLELLNSGEMNKSHMVLEEVRYLLWEMRVNADIISLTDKANDFHEALEVVLSHAGEATSAEDAKKICYRYGAWFLIKWDDMANADDIASVKSDFAPAFAEGRKTVVKYLDTLKQGDYAQARKLAGSVKSAYKKVWMLENY